MKNFTLTFFILLQTLFSFAQRDPSKEILVFFKEGVEQTVNGKLLKAAAIFSQSLENWNCYTEEPQKDLLNKDDFKTENNVIS